MEIRRGQALLQTVTASRLRPKPPFPNRPRPSSSLRLRGVTPEQSPILSYFIRVAYGWSDLLLFFPLRWRGVPLRFLTRTGDLHLKSVFCFALFSRYFVHTHTHTHSSSTLPRKERNNYIWARGWASLLSWPMQASPALRGSLQLQRGARTHCSH